MRLGILYIIFSIAFIGNSISIIYNSRLEMGLNDSTMVSLARIGLTFLFIHLCSKYIKNNYNKTGIMELIVKLSILNAIMIYLQILSDFGFVVIPDILNFGGFYNLILDQKIENGEIFRKGGIFWSFQIAGAIAYAGFMYMILHQRNMYLIFLVGSTIMFTSRMYLVISVLHLSWELIERRKRRVLVWVISLLLVSMATAGSVPELSEYFFERIYKLVGWIFDSSLMMDDSILELYNQWEYAASNVSILGNQLPRGPSLGGGGDAFLPRWLIAGGIITMVPMVALYIEISKKIVYSKYGSYFILPLIFGFFKDDFLLSAIVLPFVLIYIKARE